MAHPDGRYAMMPECCRVSIVAHAPGHKFRATASGITGDVELQNGRVTGATAAVRLARLDSGDRLGNRELKKFLALETDPVARGKLSASNIRVDDHGRISGDGNLHLALGERSVTVPIQVQGHLPIAEGSLKIRFSDFGYQPPKLLFLKVKNDIDLQIEVTVRAQPY